MTERLTTSGDGRWPVDGETTKRAVLPQPFPASSPGMSIDPRQRATFQRPLPDLNRGMTDLQSAGLASQGESGQTVAGPAMSRLLDGCSAPATDSDLTRLIDAWPELPEHVRRTILTLADGCR